MLNVVQIAAQAYSELGLPAPTQVVGGNTADGAQILALLNRAGNEIANFEGGWPELRGEQLITLVSGQQAYSFPTDILYYRAGTSWDRSTHWRTVGPLSDREWQAIRSGIAVTAPQIRFRLFGGQIQFDPVPTGTSTDLLINGGFSNGTANWTPVNATLSIAAGQILRVTKTATPAYAYQAIVTEIGKTYNISVSLIQGSAGAGNTRLLVGTSAGLSDLLFSNIAGQNVYSFTATSTTSYIALDIGNPAANGTYGDFGYVSIPNDGSTAETIVFEYVSKNWCQSATGTAQSAFVADTDLPIITDDLLVLGLKWRLLAARSFNYAEEAAQYEEALNRRYAQLQANDVLLMGRQSARIGGLGLPQIPDGNWPGR